jgi:hypothetical protein
MVTIQRVVAPPTFKMCVDHEGSSGSICVSHIGVPHYYYTARDGSPLTIAGLWDEWKDSETGLPLMSCTNSFKRFSLKSIPFDALLYFSSPADRAFWLCSLRIGSCSLRTWKRSRRTIYRGRKQN